jgi:hypothetical protein
VVLSDPTGTGPNISLDRVPEDRLPPLGELSRDDFVVLVDPDGNRFCVVGKADEP